MNTAITTHTDQAGMSMADSLEGGARRARTRATVAGVKIEQLTGAAGLEALLASARAAGRCALDTEFVWERTYAPVLCLVQVATPDRLAVGDPVQGAPLEPMARTIAQPSGRKAMHAPSGDLTGFALHFGTGAAAVFDAQLAAGLAGCGGSLS